MVLLFTILLIIEGTASHSDGNLRVVGSDLAVEEPLSKSF